MLEDIKTFLWFITRPNLYPALIDLIIRKFFLSDEDTIQKKKLALDWCEEKAISHQNLYQELGIGQVNSFKNVIGENNYSLISEKIQESDADFGGPGDLDLLYNICREKNIVNAIETGVAYGWSSSAILNGISEGNGTLVSVDMPMPKQSDYHMIGVAVQDIHQDRWKLIRKPDKYGLLEAIKLTNGPIDLIHYDSDKSYYGRKWASPIIMKHLALKGYFISDDIEDNMFFKEFVEKNNLQYWVTKVDNKFIGIIQKL